MTKEKNHIHTHVTYTLTHCFAFSVTHTHATVLLFLREMQPDEREEGQLIANIFTAIGLFLIAIFLLVTVETQYSFIFFATTVIIHFIYYT